MLSPKRVVLSARCCYKIRILSVQSRASATVNAVMFKPALVGQYLPHYETQSRRDNPGVTTEHWHRIKLHWLPPVCLICWPQKFDQSKAYCVTTPAAGSTRTKINTCTFDAASEVGKYAYDGGTGWESAYYQSACVRKTNKHGCFKVCIIP